MFFKILIVETALSQWIH